MQKKKVVIIISTILFVGCAIMGYFIYKKINDKADVTDLGSEFINEDGSIVVEKKSKIYSGNDRPIAVMIDNNKNALPHAGLSEAYMVYEIIVEGGESRLMALFKGANLEKIGPVRSSRHYFLDYALENDAIYVHYGWSPQAQSDISSLGVNNVNGLTDDSVFWRVKDKVAPHNAVTSTKKILDFAKQKGYRTTSTVSSVLKYANEEINLDSSDSMIANNVVIPYSQSNNVKWVYNENTKKYTRYTKNVKEVEWGSNEDVEFKNIIVEFVKNYKMDDVEDKDRQNLSNIGNKEGYYITNGKAIKITCSKTARSGKTKYVDVQGNEIEVNDDNTFVQICPIDANVKFE